ncbi:hypothetical protein [Myroides sp. DW712]|uniref:hypothetical protein n=1 Tax=Myroides sp. DW712 TaxID=3389800 RepID=UPI003979ABF8
MKNKIFKSIGASAIVGAFIFLAFGSGDNNGKTINDINNTTEVQQFIIGRWSTEYYSLGERWYVRYELTDSKIRVWEKFGQHDWSNSPTTYDYYLGSVKTEYDGRKYRLLVIQGKNLGMMGDNALYVANGCLKIGHSSLCLSEGWD